MTMGSVCRAGIVRACPAMPKQPCLRRGWALGTRTLGRRARGLSVAAASWWWLVGVTPLLAQTTVEEAVHVRRPIMLLTDRRVAARLQTADEYAQARQWQAAIAIFQEVCDAHPDILVARSESHFLNLLEACQRRIARWPAEGLQAYRDAVDPRARQWLAASARTPSEDDSLERILRQAYCSSFGDEALYRLAEQAWERGEIGLARSLWIQLLPRAATAIENVTDLRYPDPDFPPAEIQSRVILCSLAQGQIERARREFVEFQGQYAAATGQLAGRSGPLVSILADLFERSEAWRPDAGHTDTAMDVDVGAIGWSVRLPPPEFSGSTLWRTRSGTEPALTYLPTCYEDHLFVSDMDRILGFAFDSGQAAWWPTGVDATRDETEDQRTRLERATLYPALRVTDPVPAPQSRPLGRHRFRVAVTEGRLLARLGSPVTAPGRRELQVHDSRLVCLDLRRGEGKVVWTLAARQLDPLATFEGTPAVMDDRAFVVLRRSEPQTQLEAVCVSVENGRVVWRNPLCGAVSPFGRDVNLMTDLRFCTGAGLLFLSTDLGAVLAIDATDGLLKWAFTYPSRWADPELRRRNLLSNPGPTCLYHDNVVYATPADSPAVLALDARGGHLLWQTRLPDRIQHLIGVADERVIVSGGGLWGLEATSGQVVWGSENRDPEHSGVGRGLIHGTDVWWPQHERIQVRDLRSGRLTRQPIELGFRGGCGGNLLFHRGQLVIAEPNRIVVYSRFGGPRHPGTRRMLSLSSELPPTQP